MKAFFSLLAVAVVITSSSAQTPVPVLPPDTPRTVAPAPPPAPTVKITGQVRERTEIDGRAFTAGLAPDVVHYLRSRLGVSAVIGDDLAALVEVQDARAFGQTRSTLNAGAPAFDLRQAWVEVRKIAGAPVGVKVGRQSIAYANERLIGRIDWRNDGQSFDGAVATLGLGDLSVDFLGLAIARNANTTRYQRDVFLTGAWAQWKQKDLPVGVQGYLLYDNPRADSIRRQNRLTAGIYSNGAIGGLDYEVDAAYQFGEHIQEGESAHRNDIAASLIGARVGYTLKEVAGLRIGVGYDRLSGSDPGDPDTYGSFHTLYGTNHKFYGYMDYLLNIPLHTKGMGLQDLMLNLSVVPLENLKVSADVHQFLLAIDPATMTSEIGRELDLTIAYAASKNLSVTLGYSVFDGDPERLVLTGARRTTQWGYAMVAVGF